MFFEDVSVGDKLPPISLEITVTKLVLQACATRDLYPVHHDRDFARANNTKDMFVNTSAYGGFFNRLITDWAGPRSRLKSLGYNMLEMNYPGDIMTASGIIAKKYTANEEKCVDLELSISNQRGLTTSGKACVVLPRRGEK
ncbi:hypothetical protein ACFLV5_01775 [Chloroflexota bacterium]